MLPSGYHELAAAAQDALREVRRVAQGLGGRTIEARSEDGAVVAVVSLHARMTGLTLRPDALRSDDSTTLGEVIAATIRGGQVRARSAYDAAVVEATPPAVGEYLELLRRACGG